MKHDSPGRFVDVADVATMFHVKHTVPAGTLRALSWAGAGVTETVLGGLARYVDLLVTEGVTAGGLGPNEIERIWPRHITDSLCFGKVAEGDTWLDVGSGVGLPAIPLAFGFPGVSITALDRSGRRIELLERWRRILGLGNLTVIQCDIAAYSTIHDSVLFRASLQESEARDVIRRLARRTGVFGLTHNEVKGSAYPPGAGTDVISVPRSVLDTGATLLRIAP